MNKQQKSHFFMTVVWIKSLALWHKLIQLSRLAPSIWAEKCSWTPLLLNYFKRDFFLYIDCISKVLNLHFFPGRKNIIDKTPFVRRLGFRFWNFSFSQPFKFFQVLLKDWSNTMQSGLFTGKPPWSSCSKSVKSVIVVRSFTLPAPHDYYRLHRFRARGSRWFPSE